MPARIGNDYIIRFTVTSYYTTEEDITRDWLIIKATADQVLDFIENEKIQNEKKKQFQSSLMLSNVPQTPKIVNASFLAFFMDQDLASERVKALNTRDYLQSPLPLTARRSAKQKSYLNNASLKGASFDQSVGTQITNPVSTSMVSFNASKDATADSTTTTESLDLIEIYQKNMSLNTNVIKKNSTQLKYIKQASLDSKIQYIYEEVDDLDNQQTTSNHNNGPANDAEGEIRL